MSTIMIEIEHNIPTEEFNKFRQLSEQWGKTLQETIETCMYEKRDEYLDMFKNNVPKDMEVEKETQ